MALGPIMTESMDPRFKPDQVSDDLYRLPVPIQDDYPVNVWLVKATDGIRLIDGGFTSLTCQTELHRQVRSLGFSMADVRSLLITHTHADHYGAAQELASMGVEVLMHRFEAHPVAHLSTIEPWLRLNGFPVELKSADWPPALRPPPRSRFIEDGERLQWGDLKLEVIWCPGHRAGLLCLLERDRRLLFSSDHVMRRSHAQVSLYMNDGGDPLGDYMAAIRRLTGLPVDTVLPGHGRPFGGLTRRLAEIETHHHQRLDLLVSAIDSGPATAYELMSRSGVEFAAPWTADHAIRTRAALSQALACLRHLERLGKVTARYEGDVLLYGRV
jgi:glyoxylase-like metal-dependent hydrolase (beta-lactamase superfamily II)